MGLPNYQQPPHLSGMFVIIYGPTLMHHNHPKSIVNLGVHSWCCTFFGCGLMYNDRYPLHCITQSDFCVLCALLSHLSTPLQLLAITDLFPVSIFIFFNAWFSVGFLFFFFLIYFLAVLGLRFCARAFSSCGERGHSSSRCAGLSLSRPLLLWSTGSRRAGSVIVAHGPSCSVACGVFPDQGSNPCPLHWQADSQPLRHQGSPCLHIFAFFQSIF